MEIMTPTSPDPTGEMTLGLVFMIVILLYVIFGGEEEH